MSRLHVVSVPWSETTDAFSFCGHTAMTGRFATMCARAGHEVLLYGGEANDADCKEHLTLVSRHEQKKWFAGHDIRKDLAATPGLWDASSPWWQAMNARAAATISQHAEPDDLLALIGGGAQGPLREALLPMRSIEWGVGYEGPIADCCCYASNAWRSYLHGRWGWTEGRFYDATIPHFFDPDDFHLADKDDYLLYLGRLNKPKGLWVANDVAKRTGRRLLLAGQGDPTLAPDGEYLGVVSTEERADLLAGAHALLVPSLYLEPFGNVAVEAMLSGTPVITTDWGAFPELVEDGVTGFRCNSLGEFSAMADEHVLDPATIRARAIARFSMDAVMPLYERWFERIAALDGAGWYA